MMLRVAVSELRARVPGLELAIDPSYGRFDERTGLSLIQMVPTRGHVGSLGWGRRFGVQKAVGHGWRLLRNRHRVRRAFVRYGMCSIAETDALVDLSGFAFSDQWGPRPLADFVDLATYYARRDRPVIMLPQAFGPFVREESRKLVRALLRLRPLVFARDSMSIAHLEDAADPGAMVLHSPDVTLLYGSGDTLRDPATTESVCIVPNQRIPEMTTIGFDDYCHLLIETATAVIEAGLRPLLLIHDTSGGDLAIAERVQRHLSESTLKIECADDPVELKGTLGRSRFVVGSRYHALVGALGQCVPAIAVGWSHKYEGLRDLFPDGLLLMDPAAGREEARRLVGQLADISVNRRCRGKLQASRQHARSEIEEMWSRVVTLLQR